MDTAPFTFLALPPDEHPYESAAFAVLPVPYDATTSFQVGARQGPAAIIAASREVELFDEELSAEFVDAGVVTLDPVAPVMSGPDAMHGRVYDAARRVHDDGKFLLALGGEHGISSALIRAARDRYRSVSVLQIDAHLDLREAYQGTKYSHASVMRRVLDMGLTLVPVGIRNVCREEHEFLGRSDLRPLMARDCRGGDDWIDQAVERLGEHVYVTIDIDGFDPAYAPGTGTPEPGGLDWYQVTALLRRTAERRRIVAADVVEVLPIGGQAVTEFLAARLAYKLICYVQWAANRTARDAHTGRAESKP
ncbi:MAG: agmatinase [Phycisphaerales bacterium]|nr:MAG: agmatinase [Phycisphaerales bacterium]